MSFAQNFMPRPIVSFSHVSKDYTLFSSFSDKFKSLFFDKPNVKTYRAVNDVSLVLRQGEIVGLVGLAGSGKSTVASLITGSVHPTEGRIRVKGEVCCVNRFYGLCPELTGKDNIRLRCAAAGISNKESDAIEKETAELADVNINNEVKTYSDSMASDLSFAVGACTNSDIIIIDASLGADDGLLSDKFFNKINELKSKGKTIVIIGRDARSLTKYCERIIWINKGRIIGDGESKLIAAAYSGFVGEYESMTDDERAYAHPEFEYYLNKYSG